MISNAHITQEWQLIVNTAMTENQRFFTTEIDIAHITNITHEHNYNLRSERREMKFPKKSWPLQDLNSGMASCIVDIGANHYAIPHPLGRVLLNLRKQHYSPSKLTIFFENFPLPWISNFLLFLRWSLTSWAGP